MKKIKIKRVLELSEPKSVKDILKFLGLANYYWQFVKNFVKIVKTIICNSMEKLEVEIE